MITDTYDPQVDVMARWPEWRFQRSETNFHEHGDRLDFPSIEICVDDRLILIHTHCDDYNRELARAIAYLDLGVLDAEGWLTEQQQSDAQGLADLRMGEITWETFA